MHIERNFMTGFHWQMNRAGLALLVLVLGGAIADAQSDRVFPKEGRTLGLPRIT